MIQRADRAVRSAVLLLTLSAAGCDLYFSSVAWQYLPVTALGAFALGAVLVRLRPGWAAALASFTAFITPALVLIVFGRVTLAHTSLWTWLVLGVFTGARGFAAWALPPLWRFPIAAWALVVGIGLPIVALRELDFTLAFLASNAPRPVHGLWPSVIIRGVCGITAISGTGFLWFDWLHARYGDGLPRLRREVLAPLVASATLAMLAGIYQGYVDLRWLSTSIWPAHGRATGTLADANVFGTTVALCGPLGAALILVDRRPARAAAAGLLLVLSWVAVWSSASRTALLTAIVASAALLWILRPRWMAGRTALAAGVAAFVLAAALVVAGLIPRAGPVERIAQMFPERSLRGAAHVAVSLWSRDMYGTASTRAIADFPWFGIGHGMFYPLVRDYSTLLGRRVPADNAQNWFRHQLAELGIIGSLPWIAWVVLVVWRVIRGRGSGALEVRAARGCLLALTLASLLGMPTQYGGLTLMFWTLAFLAIDPWASARPQATWPPRAMTIGWLAVALIPIVYAAGTLYQARHDLRPAFRAAKFDFDYGYGFDFQPANVSSGRHALAVPRASDKWLKLTYWVEHPDADQNRVQVDIWRDGEHIVGRRLSRNVPVTEYVAVTPGKRFVLEAKVDRTFTSNGAERGLAMKWEFVSSRP